MRSFEMLSIVLTIISLVLYAIFRTAEIALNIAKQPPLSKERGIFAKFSGRGDWPLLFCIITQNLLIRQVESAGVAESDVTNGGIFSYITRLRAEIGNKKVSANS